jgi:hypothetical protein
MRLHRKEMRVGCLALFVTALGALGFVGSASAKLTGDFTVFGQCPFANPEVRKCISAVTQGGEIAIGGTKVALVNPVTIQGGFTRQDEEGNARMVDAVNGMTMPKTPQPVPGGLRGLASAGKAPLLLQTLLRALSAKLNQVNATLEFARPTNEVVMNENNFAGETGPGLTMPVKVHLENPLLGGSCYIGSSAAPIVLALTAGTTSPPPPNLPIAGTLGLIEFLAEGSILEVNGAVLVDNSFSVPKASGCGGTLSSSPSSAGHNTVIMKSKLMVGAAAAVRRNNEENP